MIKRMKSKKFNYERTTHILILTIAISAIYNILAVKTNELFINSYDENKSFILYDSMNYFYFSVGIFFLVIFFSVYSLVSKYEKEAKILVLHGAGPLDLSDFFIDNFLMDGAIACLVGLPLGIVIGEIFNLTVIANTQIELTSHSLLVDPKVLFYIILMVFATEILSLIISCVHIYKRNPEVLNPKQNKFIVIIIFLVLAGILLYMLNAKNGFYSSIIFIMLFITLVITSLMRLIVNKIRIGRNFFMSSNLKEFFYKKHFNIMISLFLMLASTIFFYNGTSNYIFYYGIEASNRPDFTIFDNGEGVLNLDSIDGLDPKIEEIFPIKVVSEAKVDDREFTALHELYNFSESNSRKANIVSLSTFKKILPDSKIDTIGNGETIYLMGRDMDGAVSLKAINRDLSHNNTTVNISGSKFNLIAADLAYKAFANDTKPISDIYVIADEVFDEMFMDAKPYAYNIYLSDSYIKDYGYLEASEEVRNILLKNNFTFESLVWALKYDYSSIVSNLYFLFFICLTLYFVSISFFMIVIGNYTNEKMDTFKTLVLLGADNHEILEEIKGLRNLILRIYIISFLFSYIISLYYLNKMSDFLPMITNYDLLMAETILLPIILSIMTAIFVRLVLNFNRISIEESN